MKLCYAVVIQFPEPLYKAQKYSFLEYFRTKNRLQNSSYFSVCLLGWNRIIKNLERAWKLWVGLEIDASRLVWSTCVASLRASHILALRIDISRTEQKENERKKRLFCSLDKKGSEIISARTKTQSEIFSGANLSLLQQKRHTKTFEIVTPFAKMTSKIKWTATLGISHD